jgi:AraC-like DNA-binding protein
MSEAAKNISDTHRLRLPGPVGFGVVTYRRRGAYGPRIQQNYQLVVLHSGSVVVTIDGAEHYVGTGDGILLKPGHEEFFRFDAQRESRHSWCQVPEADLPEGMKFPASSIARSAPCSVWLLNLMKLGLCADFHAQATTSRQAAVSTVLSAQWSFVSGLPASGAGGQTPEPEALRRAGDLIALGFAESLCLTDLARAAGVSGGHFIHLARKHWGMTPMEKLWQTRLSHAARMLRETGLSVAETAYRCGFANPFHFSRRFKKRFGADPRAWRQKQWEAAGSGS